MSPPELIDLLGGTNAVARRLGIKPPSVSEWRKNGMPDDKLILLAVDIERASRGRCVVGTCVQATGTASGPSWWAPRVLRRCNRRLAMPLDPLAGALQAVCAPRKTLPCTELREFLDREGVVGKRVAARAGLTSAFLSQIALGQRPVPPTRCWAIERATGMVVRRWHLRPNDWHEIWPELIGAEGAPALQQEVGDAA